MNLNRTDWNSLAAMLGIANPGAIFDELEARYGERHRKYHNATHINDCLAKLNSSNNPDSANPLVEYSLWFHDLIYNTRSNRNERDSADRAIEILEAAGRPQAEVDTVDALIMATSHGGVPTDPREQLLIDIDLSILGAESDRFDAFEHEIRGEYWWVPAPIYKKRRTQLLQGFMQRESVYCTEEFQNLYEAQAQSNLKRAWATLNN